MNNANAPKKLNLAGIRKEWNVMFSYNIIVLFLLLYHFTFIFQIIYRFYGNSGDRCNLQHNRKTHSPEWEWTNRPIDGDIYLWKRIVYEFTYTCKYENKIEHEF